MKSSVLAVTHTDQTDESAAAGTIAIVIVAVCIIVGVIVAVVILRLVITMHVKKKSLNCKGLCHVVWLGIL